MLNHWAMPAKLTVILLTQWKKGRMDFHRLVTVLHSQSFWLPGVSEHPLSNTWNTLHPKGDRQAHPVNTPPESHGLWVMHSPLHPIWMWPNGLAITELKRKLFLYSYTHSIFNGGAGSRKPHLKLPFKKEEKDMHTAAPGVLGERKGHLSWQRRRFPD